VDKGKKKTFPAASSNMPYLYIENSGTVFPSDWTLSIWYPSAS